MTASSTGALNRYFQSLLNIESFCSIDSSLNGLQVDNNGAEIMKIAFAVDACLETCCRCAEAGCGMLFVHHGLFWGKPLMLKGPHRERLKFLLDNNIALYAVHLPLDQHPNLGNNYTIAGLLGVEAPEPFGLYHGIKIGCKGRLRKALTVEEAAAAISYMNRPPLGIYPFGKERNETCAIISGGASMEALQAIDERIDLYVTGETSHTAYHHALEGRLNIVAGGHYSTEVWGVRAVMQTCAESLDIDVEFIDTPTGL
jgi:dinuclear metal center YbgI/SA1388 family protein